MAQNRNLLLDVLKGIAIIGVILYHCGLMKYGYLGVELFLVVAGYLTTKGIMRRVDAGEFSYRNFVGNRLVRLWSLLLIVTTVTLVLGYVWMLPHDFKLHCEGVAASSLFLNNVVQMVTSGDYWNVSNDLKPLMHTWYVGIILQFYIVYPLIFLLAARFANDVRNTTRTTLWIVFFVTLLLYTLPVLSNGQNFYLLPSRLFEFAAGGLVALMPVGDRERRSEKSIILLSLVVVVLLLVLNADFNVAKVRLLTTVGVATLMLIMVEQKPKMPQMKWFKWLALIGMASYSLFLWHQPILAFYRYVFNYNITASAYVMVISLSLIVGFISYYALEQPIVRMAKCHKMGGVTFFNLLFASILVATSYWGYRHKGVVRDVPELEIRADGKGATIEPQDYNERIYSYDHDFPKNGRENVLVIGDSFGRDWINILRESHVDSLVNISYHTEVDDAIWQRINDANCVFVAYSHSVFAKYSKIIPLIADKRYYIVGCKYYGATLGNVYNNGRYDTGYFAQRYTIDKEIVSLNDEERQLFTTHYIDIMGVVTDDNQTIPAFTPDHKLISHDGLHLTRAGARWYAHLLDVRDYL